MDKEPQMVELRNQVSLIRLLSQSYLMAFNVRKKILLKPFLIIIVHLGVVQNHQDD